MYQSIPKPPAKPWAFDCLKNFGEISQYVDSLDGQMLHLLTLQKASNTPLTSGYLKFSHSSKPFIQN